MAHFLGVSIALLLIGMAAVGTAACAVYPDTDFEGHDLKPGG
jgi:hypothetical protein